VSSVVQHNSNFRLLWVGETASGLGSAVSTIVVPLIAVTILHSSPLVVSAIAAAAWLPWLLIGLAAGPFVDVVPIRGLMIACDLVAGLLFASVPLSYLAGVLGPVQLLVVAFGAGCVTVVFNTAHGRILLDLVEPPGDRAKANSLIQGSASAVRIAGVGVGGVLVQLLGAATALLFDSLSFLVSAVCLARVRMPARATTHEVAKVPLHTQVREGIGFSFGDPLMRPLVLFGGCANFALVGYQSILVVFLVRTVGLSAGAVGVLLALMSCGGVIGAFVGNPLARKIGSGRALYYAKVCACPFALLIPLTSSGLRISLLVVGGLGVGIGIVAGNVVSSGFFQSYTPTELFARASATQNVFNYGTIPLGALLAGTLATVYGVQSALWVMTALLPCSALLLVVSPFRRLRELPTITATWPLREATLGGTAT
jgi:predicted MFS family arabinose efflux permease